MFDLSVGFILKQGCPSINERGDCFYDRGDGKHCAAWPLLDKDSPITENFGIEENKLKDEFEGYEYFASALQNCHDQSAFDPIGCYILSDEEFIEKFITMVKDEAELYELNTNVITEYEANNNQS
jgi:hypothetical protein